MHRKHFSWWALATVAALWLAPDWGEGHPPMAGRFGNTGIVGEVGGAPPTVQSRRLLLDARLIERTENAVLRVGTVRKHPNNPLFGEDRPREARFDNLYPNVLFDAEEQLYRIWYKTFTRDAVTSEGEPVPRELRVRGTYGNFARRRGDGLCYAVSRDGLVWEKPLLEHGLRRRPGVPEG